MRQNKKKLAFIGGGINSSIGLVHKIASEMDGKFELVAGCFSRTPDINKKSATTYSVESHRIYDDINDLVACEKNKIDAFCVLTPTPEHFDNLKILLQHKVNVICEKALCLTYLDALKILEMQNHYGCKIVVTYNYTGYPMVRELRNLIISGELGKIHQINIEMLQDSFIVFNKDIKQWRLKEIYFLPMLYLDLGIHLYSLIYFLVSYKPKKVFVVENNFSPFKKVIDDVIGIIKCENGLIINLHFSKTVLGHRNALNIKVYGSKGAAEWFHNTPEILRVTNENGDVAILDRMSYRAKVAKERRYNRFKVGHPAGFIEAFANYYSDIYDYLNGRNNNYVFELKMSVEGMRLLETMHKSALSGKEIAL